MGMVIDHESCERRESGGWAGGILVGTFGAVVALCFVLALPVGEWWGEWLGSNRRSDWSTMGVVFDHESCESGGWAGGIFVRIFGAVVALRLALLVGEWWGELWGSNRRSDWSTMGVVFDHESCERHERLCVELL